MQLLDPAAGGQVLQQQHPIAIEIRGGRQGATLGQRLESLQTLGILRIEQAVLPLPGDIAGALADHAKQLAQMTDALAEEFFLFGQLGLLTIEFGFQALGLGLLGLQGCPRVGEQLRPLATLGYKRLLATVHGRDFGGAFAANALQQLIRTERGGGTGNRRQQRQGQDGEDTTAHCLASWVRVCTGRSSRAGACS